MDTRNTIIPAMSAHLNKGEFTDFFNLVKQNKDMFGDDLVARAEKFLETPQMSIVDNETRIDEFINAMREKINDKKTVDRWEMQIAYAYYFRDEAITRLNRALHVKLEKYHELQKAENLNRVDSILDDIEKLEKKLGGLKNLKAILLINPHTGKPEKTIEQLTAGKAVIDSFNDMVKKAQRIRVEYIHAKEANPTHYRENIKALISNALASEYNTAITIINKLLSEFNENAFLTPAQLESYASKVNFKYTQNSLSKTNEVTNNLSPTTSLVNAYTDHYMREQGIDMNPAEQVPERAATRIYFGIVPFDNLDSFAKQLKKIIYRERSDELLITPLEMPWIPQLEFVPPMFTVTDLDDDLDNDKRPEILNVVPIEDEPMQTMFAEPLSDDEDDQYDYGSDLDSDKEEEELGGRGFRRKGSDSDGEELGGRGFRGKGRDSDDEELGGRGLKHKNKKKDEAEELGDFRKVRPPKEEDVDVSTNSNNVHLSTSRTTVWAKKTGKDLPDNADKADKKPSPGGKSHGK